MTCFWTLAKIHVNMNTLATSLYHTTFKCIPRHNKLVVKCLSSQAAVDKNVSFRKRKPISKAMRAYIDRVKEFEANFAKESAEYVSGKRFLANVMCEDPNNFTDEDVKKSLEYLLPSGLYQLSTRPTMEPPKELVETSKFDVHGRPYHYLFYTAAPKMYELQHEAVVRLNKADKLLEEAHRKGHVPENEDMLDTLGSEWVNNNELSNIINENVRERHFESVMDVLKRLCDHPMSAHFEDFIMTYRKNTSVMLSERKFPEVMQKEDGGLYVQTKETRKTSTATVTIHSPGTGKICINKSHDLLYFRDFQSRNQIIHPLQMAGLTNKVDVYAEVFGGGYSGQAGAIRYGVTVCVAALSNEEIRTKLHIAGLLTRDRRVKERKKTGKKGARRSYTWLKR